MILYIDPGTGSMLFTIIIGVIGFLTYFFKVLLVKVKFLATKGKSGTINENKIPFLIFAESKRYWNVFRPVVHELENRGFDILYWTTSQDDPAFEENNEHFKAEFIGEGNKAFSKLNMVNASIILSTTPGLNVYQWKRSKLVDHYMHIMHGPNEIAGYRMFGIDFYDSILVSGKYMIDDVRELEVKRNLPAKEVVLTGIPYMDEMRDRVMKEKLPANEDTCVLLAPSWGASSIFNVYGDKVLKQLVESGFKVIVRPHPQSFESEASLIQGIMDRFPESDQVHWDRSSDNFESLNKADILISDFSGVIFDFTLAFDKPVIYTDSEFKKDCYDHYWLDKEKLWTFEAVEKMGTKLTPDNLSELKPMIEECLKNERFAEARDNAREGTWANIGEGASRTADFIIKKYNELSKKK